MGFEICRHHCLPFILRLFAAPPALRLAGIFFFVESSLAWFRFIPASAIVFVISISSSPGMTGHWRREN
jgi:hypothetical protein